MCIGKRKLKCSGEPTGCARCVKQNLTCHFSAQKQMGRPRKRQKTDDVPNNEEIPPARPAQSKSSQSQHAAQRPPQPPTIDPNLTEKDVERTSFQNLCGAAIAQSIRKTSHEARMTAQRTSSKSNGNGNGGRNTHSSSKTSSYDDLETPPNGSGIPPDVGYPTDVSQWPDFSDLSMLPMLVQDSHEHAKASYEDSNPGHSIANGSTPYSNYMPDPDANPITLTQLPPVPACPCLPNIYLTLSTLSALSAFPVSSGMLDALMNAHRIARSVIYCPVCPQKMQSGSQNVFFSTTLITVVADHWHRVRKASAKELKVGFGSSDSESAVVDEPMNVREDLEWRTFGYHLIRAYVFGDQGIPFPPTSTVMPASATNRTSQIMPTHTSTSESDTSTIYTLDSLIQALERRQKQWHDVAPFVHSQEFGPKLGHTNGHNLPADAHAHAHEFPGGYTPGMTLEDIKQCENEYANAGGKDEGILCLRLVKHNRMMLKSLEGPVPMVEG